MTQRIVTNSVTDGSVTADKLADGAVTLSKLAIGLGATGTQGSTGPVDSTNTASLANALFNNTGIYAIRAGGSDHTPYLLGYHFIQIVRRGITGYTSTFVNAASSSSFLG